MIRPFSRYTCSNISLVRSAARYNLYAHNNLLAFHTTTNTSNTMPQKKKKSSAKKKRPSFDPEIVTGAEEKKIKGILVFEHCVS
jgi:hypothetical protein